MYNDDDLLYDIKNGWNQRMKSLRRTGFIIAVLMIAVGVLCLIWPVQSTYALELIASILILAVGIWQLVRYFKLPVIWRNGAGLISGILNIILGMLLVTSPAPDLLVSFGFLFGMDMLVLGFEQLSATGTLSAVGVSGTGWITLNAVLNIIVGLILLFSPITSVIAISIVVALYLIVGGITILIGCMKTKDIQ